MTIPQTTTAPELTGIGAARLLSCLGTGAIELDDILEEEETSTEHEIVPGVETITIWDDGTVRCRAIHDDLPEPPVNEGGCPVWRIDGKQVELVYGTGSWGRDHTWVRARTATLRECGDTEQADAMAADLAASIECERHVDMLEDTLSRALHDVGTERGPEVFARWVATYLDGEALVRRPDGWSDYTYVAVNDAELRRWWGTEGSRDEQVLGADMDEVGAWLRHEVWGWVVEHVVIDVPPTVATFTIDVAGALATAELAPVDPGSLSARWEELDSCWGYYGNPDDSSSSVREAIEDATSTYRTRVGDPAGLLATTTDTEE